MTNLFENYLKEAHAKQYFGIDDDMPDAFENWLSNLDIEELLQYGHDAIMKTVKAIAKLEIEHELLTKKE